MICRRTKTTKTAANEADTKGDFRVRACGAAFVPFVHSKTR